MKQIKLLIAVTVALMVASCSTSGDNSGAAADVATDTIVGHQIALPDEFDGIYPADFIDDILVYTSYDFGHRYVKGRIDGDTLVDVQHFIGQGIGPGQMMASAIKLLSPTSFGVINQNNGDLGDLTYWQVPSDGDFSRAEPKTVKSLKLDHSTFAMEDRFIPVDSGRVILFASEYDNPNTIISEIDYDNKKLNSLQLWPEDDFKGNPRIKRAVYNYSAYLATNGDGMYVYAAYTQPYMFLFKIENGKAQIVKTIYTDKPGYRVADDGRNFELQSKLPHELRTFSNSRHIYALHRDRDYDDKPAKTANDARCGHRVDVFNWQGELERTLWLDKPGVHIVAHNNDSCLYVQGVADHQGQMTLRRYDL